MVQSQHRPNGQAIIFKQYAGTGQGAGGSAAVQGPGQQTSAPCNAVPESRCGIFSAYRGSGGLLEDCLLNRQQQNWPRMFFTGLRNRLHFQCLDCGMKKNCRATLSPAEWDFSCLD